MTMPHFAYRLGQLVSMRQISMTELAQRMSGDGFSVHRSQLSRLASGDSDNPSAALVGRLAKALDVDVRFFFDEAFAEETFRGPTGGG